MKKTILSSLVVLACTPTLASADDGFGPLQEGYVGTQYGQVTSKASGAPGDYKLDGLAVKVGYDINQYFAVEGRVGGSVKSDTNANVTMDLDYFYGLYGVGTLHLIPQLDAYGVLGYTRGQVSASGGGVSITESDSGLSYGVGVGWNIDPAVSLSLEYMSYMNKSNFEAKAITIGLSNRF